jgi:hypothetical protein
MKPTLYKYINENGAVYIEDEDIDIKVGVTKIPLYTAHEIANFVRGLYFDSRFPTEVWVANGKSVYATIAEIIEKESQK